MLRLRLRCSAPRRASSTTGESVRSTTPWCRDSPVHRPSPSCRGWTRSTARTSPSSGCRSTPACPIVPALASGRPTSVRRRVCCGPSTRPPASRRSPRSRSSTPATSPPIPSRSSEAITQVERSARALVERAPRLLVLGGDHTIALPLLRALKLGRSLSPWCTSTPISTPGTPTSGRRTPTARLFVEPPRKDCSTRPRVSTSAPAVRCTAPETWSTTRSSASPWSPRPRSMRSERRGWRSGSELASAGARSTSRSTSTSSTRRSPPAPGPPRPAA